MNSTNVKVSSSKLRELQGSLLALSKLLSEYHDLLKIDMRKLSEAWEDRKFLEFSTEFEPSIKKIEEISDRYKDWANAYLPSRIEILERIEKASMSL